MCHHSEKWKAIAAATESGNSETVLELSRLTILAGPWKELRPALLILKQLGTLGYERAIRVTGGPPIQLTRRKLHGRPVSRRSVDHDSGI
jgi:hypothetical protein